MIPFRSKTMQTLLQIKRLPGISRTVMTQVYDDVQFSQDGKTAMLSLSVPFLPDRAARMPLSIVPELSEIGYSILSNKDTPQREAGVVLQKSRLIVVMKSQIVSIFPEFYKYMKSNNRLMIQYCLRDVGEKSFNGQAEIYDETNTILLSRNIRTIVLCDINLKPIPFPKQASELLKSLAIHQDKFFVPLPFTRKPESFFTTHIAPRSSDLDVLYHVNQATYLTFMLDAAVKAAKAGAYNCLKQDIAFASIDQASLIYSKELLVDDDVKIETWEDEEIPLKVCFEMSTNSQLAFQGSILLREPLLKLSSKVKQYLPRAKEF